MYRKANFSSENKQKKEITHDNLMNFLSKKYTQLSRIDENSGENQAKIDKRVKKQYNMNNIPKSANEKNKQEKKNKEIIEQNGNQTPNNKKNNRISMEKDERDSLWDKNYKIKLSINEFREENSKLKSKIGNLEVKLKEIFKKKKCFYVFIREKIKCYKNNSLLGN